MRNMYYLLLLGTKIDYKRKTVNNYFYNMGGVMSGYSAPLSIPSPEFLKTNPIY